MELRLRNSRYRAKSKWEWSGVERSSIDLELGNLRIHWALGVKWVNEDMWELSVRWIQHQSWSLRQVSSYDELREVFTFLRLFHMESRWNPWNPSGILYGIHGMNVGWDPSQFLILWTSWIPCGMRIEWSIPHGFYMDSPGFHMECRHIHLGFHGISAGIQEKLPYLITKNSHNIRNWTPASTKYHRINQMSTFSAALCNHLKVWM